MISFFMFETRKNIGGVFIVFDEDIDFITDFSNV